MVGHVVRVGEFGRAYRTEVRTPLRKRTCWRPWRGWENNIKIDQSKCIKVVQDGIKLWTFVNTIINIQFLKICRFLEQILNQDLAVTLQLIEITELQKYNTPITAIIITIVAFFVTFILHFPWSSVFRGGKSTIAKNIYQAE